MLTAILVISTALQYLAAVLALRLIRVTGHWWSWSCLSAAILLMAVRRTVTLVKVMHAAGAPPPTSLTTEWIALLISVLMVAGIAGIGPVLRRLRAAEEERRRLELEAQENRRLQSLGTIAAGVAHDFNNLLTTVIAGVELARDETPEDHPVRERLRLIDEAARRSTDLTRQLLQYAGKGRSARVLVDLSREARALEPQLRRLLASNVRLEYQLDADLPAVLADRAHMHQLLVHLVLNGGEACGPAGGTVRVRTLRDGRWAVVEVQDDGCGMDEAIRARMFDPFFTTKFPGRGLGLAAVSGIVRGHGGEIRVDSVEGRGTTFRVALPAESGMAAASPAEAEKAVRRAATVLVVDDESAVRSVLSEGLSRLGHQVLCAPDAASAIGVLARGEPVDVVLLDLTMPGLAGGDAVRRLRRERPDLPIVLMSGFSDVGLPDLEEGAVQGFVAKPFDLVEVAGALSRALAARDRASTPSPEMNDAGAPPPH